MYTSMGLSLYAFNILPNAQHVILMILSIVTDNSTSLICLIAEMPTDKCNLPLPSFHPQPTPNIHTNTMNMLFHSIICTQMNPKTQLAASVKVNSQLEQPVFTHRKKLVPACKTKRTSISKTKATKVQCHTEALQVF